MFFNFNFNSSVNNSINNPQNFPNPNPNPNPSFDGVAHESLCDRLDEALYWKDVSDYLMLEEGVEERDLSQNKGDVANICDESASISVIVADDQKQVL